MFRKNSSHNQQGVFETTQWMHPKNRAIFNASWGPKFYDVVFRKIDEEPFAILYSPVKGAPNFPINILVALEYIKHMKQWTDDDLMEAFRFNSQVSYALGIRNVGEMYLTERTLYYFRERVYGYSIENPGKEDILFGQFIKLLHEFAELAGISLEEQRNDTTLFMSNIKKAGRISLAHDVLVKAVKAIPEGLRTEDLAKVLEPGFKNKVLYRMRGQDTDSRMAMLLGLCQQADAVLSKIATTADSEALRIVRRFLEEQSTIDPETGKPVPKPNKEIKSGSLQSAYDEDATFRRKGDVSQSGYALDLSETCSRDNPFQLLTDYTIRPNNVSDQEILIDRLPIIKENTGCGDMYVDGGFQSEEVHQVAADNGIEIHMTNMSGTEPKTHIPITKFDIDEDTNVIKKCPAGNVPTQAGVSKSQTSAHFPHDVCIGCAFREQCFSKQLAKDCVVRINIKAIEAGRVRAGMLEHQMENTGMRAGIEGTNSSMKRTGQDKLDVRGIAKSTVVSGLNAATQNIKRILKYLQGGYKKKPEKPQPSGIPVPIMS